MHWHVINQLSHKEECTCQKVRWSFKRNWRYGDAVLLALGWLTLIRRGQAVLKIWESTALQFCTSCCELTISVQNVNDRWLLFAAPMPSYPTAKARVAYIQTKNKKNIRIALIVQYPNVGIQFYENCPQYHLNQRKAYWKSTGSS